MITAQSLTAEMAAINRMVNATMTAIHNEHVQRVAVPHQATMTIFQTL